MFRVRLVSHIVLEQKRGVLPQIVRFVLRCWVEEMMPLCLMLEEMAMEK